MLQVCAGHSLSVANRIIDEKLLLDELVNVLKYNQAESDENAKHVRINSRIHVLHIIHALVRNGNEVARKVYEMRQMQDCLIYCLVG